MSPKRRFLAAALSLAVACERPAPARTDTATGPAADTVARPRFDECPRATAGEPLPESRAMSCGEGLVNRSGDTLTLVIPGRDTLRLVDVKSVGEDARSFLFQGSILDRRYWIVTERLYEGSRAIVIDAATGSMTTMAARPIPNAGGTLMAAGTRGLESGESVTRLEIWRAVGGALVREFSVDPNDPAHPETSWGPGGLTWPSPDTLVVQRFKPAPGEPGGERAADTVRVIHSAAGWRIFPRQ